MLIKIRIKDKTYKVTLKKVLLYVVMTAFVSFTVLPLIYVVNNAFKPMDELFLIPPTFFVRKPILKNFSDLVMSLGSSSVPFTRYLFNSVLITTITVVCTVIVSSMGAYALVKHKPPGSKQLFSLIIVALMFSPHVTSIPRYMVVNALGLINTYWALILPSIASAYNIFLMKQFMEQFPDELLESARLDGASELTIFLKIVMPSLGPAWSTLIVFSFVASWNDYFSPLIYITSQAMKTMPLALQTIAGGAATSSVGRMGAVAASTLIMTMPTVIIFTSMQKKVMETMVHSGIKG
jgi:ABC-type glycerol-3-phosphate transport system permease component